MNKKLVSVLWLTALLFCKTVNAQLSKDYFEARGIEFYKKLVVGYDLMHEYFPNRILKLDAEGPLDEVTRLILGTMENLINTNSDGLKELSEDE